MGKSAAITRTWAGGVSVDGKIGTEGSFKRSRAINHRKKVSSIELHKKYIKESGSVVDTPIYDGIRTPDSSVYFMGDTKVYRRTVDTVGAPGAYTAFKTGLTNVKSGAYNRDRKRLYMPGGKSIHAVNYTDANAPVFNENLVTTLLDKKTVNTGTAVYTPGASIDEGATHKLAFKPDVEPYIKLGFYIIAKGTGNHTITLHDQSNAVVATATLNNANITAGQINYVTFASQVRLSAKPNPYEYHIHITVSGGTASTFRSSVANDLSKADFESHADVLIDGVYHPCGEFLQYVVMGNGNYVAVWEPITDAPTKTELDPHRLKLPSEYNVLGFTEFKEYYAISAYKSVSSDYGDEFGANATEGLIGFWDGASRGFAWFVKIEGGAMESIFTFNGFIYGYVNGVLHVTSGDVPIPVYEMPGLTDFESSAGHNDDVFLRAPYKAMCVSNNILQMAYPAVTANENIVPGIYSFGRKTKDYAESIAFDHIPSHGQEVIRYDNADEPRSGITYIGRFGKNTFMAWQTLNDAGTPIYGVDVLNNTNDVYDEGEVVYLDMDNRVTYKIKDAIELIATYSKLPGNSTVKLFYSINGEDERHYGVDGELVHDTDNKMFKLPVNKQYRVIEYGVELIASTTVGELGSPVVDSTAIVIDNNSSEGL